MTFLSTQHLRKLKYIFFPSSINCFCIATRKRNDKYTIKNRDCGNKTPILSKIKRKNKQCDTRTILHPTEPFIKDKKKAMNQLPIIDCTTPSSSITGSTSNKEEKKATQKNENIFLSFALKRYLQPYKTHYELEWNIPSTTKVWLQLDKQTSRGIERVRRLGFTDLDVRLDDKLTKYMNNTQKQEEAVESILMEIVFCSGNNKHDHDNRKDSVLSNDVHLLRLRRVHWWTKDYNLARLYFA